MTSSDNHKWSFWHLNEAPFDDTKNPRFFFASGMHAQALARMTYLVKQGSVHFGMLSGEIGAGKTITANVLAQQIDDPDRIVVTIGTSHYDFPHLLAEIIDQIVDGPIDFDTFDERLLIKAFEKVCEQALLKGNHHLVVILDEAQDLGDGILRRLRNLTNLGGIEEYPITFILIGQTELIEHVRARPEIDQRIALRFHLGYLTEEEVPAYVKHRLMIAGHPDGSTFQDDLWDRLFQATRGVPREINRVARLAMDNAFARGVPFVDAQCLNEVVGDLQSQINIGIAAQTGQFLDRVRITGTTGTSPAPVTPPEPDPSDHFDPTGLA